MPSETDQELLEAYLDDALGPDEVERAALRLAQEPELAAALDEMRAQRRQRAAIWAALEPSEAAASTLSQSMLRSIRRRRMMARLSWGSRLGGAAAACILVGLSS